MLVNIVTGSPVTWVFADLLDRLKRLVTHDVVVTDRPQADADVLHFWRPHAAVRVDDLSRAVLHCHGFGYWSQGRPIYSPEVLATFGRAAAAIVLNSRDATRLRRVGVVGDRIHTIPHAVDPDIFTLRPERSDGKLCIGRVGRPYGQPDDGRAGVECKGRGTLHEIMRELQRHRDEVRWLFLGTGWQIELAFARELGFEAEFVERGPDNYPSAYVRAYHDMDVYLVTSRAEGGPASLPEALACGVWPVCTAVGMCTDLVEKIHLPLPGGGGRPLAGTLYEVNDVDAAVAAITGLLQRRHLLESARKLLRSYVEDWTWEEWARAHARVYEAVGGEA